MNGMFTPNEERLQMDQARRANLAKTRRWRAVMLFWTWFQALGALLGGTMGMLYPHGEFYGGESMVESLGKLPFSDSVLSSMFVPALALAVLIGVGNLVAAVLIMRQVRAGAVIACAEGLVIVCFTVAEIAILGSNVLSWVYCVFGIAQFLCGLRYFRCLDGWRTGK